LDCAVEWPQFENHGKGEGGSGSVQVDEGPVQPDQAGDQGERGEILANGIPGEGLIIAHGPLERGAQWFNLDIDLEVHVSGRQPYRVNNQYLVPAGATIGRE
jgi:hypothetical protein